ILWDMRFAPSTSRSPGEHRHKIPRGHVQKVATEPGTRKMRITISSRPEWEIEVAQDSQNERGFFSVEDVLCSITDYLRRPITTDEWEGMPSDRQKQLHLLRHDRLADDVVEFNADISVRYVDLLGWKTVFGGLTPLGPTEWGMEVIDRRRVPEFKKRGLFFFKK
ncbi:hypothetical protein BU17DRAFT_56758, partial [Hysterangium stoloniferum]